MEMKQTRRNLKGQLQQAAIQAKGAFLTEDDRKIIVLRFGQYLKDHNIQIKNIEHIKTRYIQGYIHERLAQGIAKRTLQNEMSAIRVTLRQAGRDKLANSPAISNKALGLSGASRKGTKIPINDSQYRVIHQKALHKDQGLAAAIELARTFGLRGEEAVQSCQSLQTWKVALENGEEKVKVIFGTKTGKPRETLIIDRQRAINAVNTALKITTTQNGKLINKPTLKQAMSYWGNHCRAIGLKGKISPHSLRYAFTHEAEAYYRKQGFSEKEWLALTSMDLGHGDGRGKYVKLVYGVKENSL